MKSILFALFMLVCTLMLSAQTAEKQLFRVVSYNVENFFDCVDDSLTNDAEYNPGGIRGWNYEKYETKQNHIARVISAIGGWEPPALVGLCEVESRRCLLDLTRKSGLKNMAYRFVHFESPDPRGIDVALLYQPEVFKPISSKNIAIHFPEQPLSRTRDLLYVSGLLPTSDTLHVFVCHFPSRLGGELESEDKRAYVASVLKANVDSIFMLQPSAKIIIMGDFNDYPVNRSLYEVLNAAKYEGSATIGSLYNLMFQLNATKRGSHKQDGEWGFLDQLIVSGSLLQTDSSVFIRPSDVHVFEADFLLHSDDKYLGKKPFRTYNGAKYQAGYSDHLPVYVDLWY